MVSALVSGSSVPGSSPGRGHCVVFLGKTLNSSVVWRGFKGPPLRHKCLNDFEFVSLIFSSPSYLNPRKPDSDNKLHILA